MPQQSTFVALLLITILAFFVPIIATRLRRLRVPIVVGEILAGMLIGKSGLDLVQESPVLTFLSQFGFTFLMFLSGLEVKIDTLLTANGNGKAGSWRRPIPIALIHFILTLLCGMTAGVWLGRLGLTKNAVLMGLILSTTSLGVVLPILKERGLTVTEFGQTVLMSAVISDFATLLLLSLSISVSRGSRQESLLFLVLLTAFVLVARLGRWMARIPLLTRIVEELSHATAQIRVRGAFALMVIWVVAAEALGVEVILGAFLAGAIVSVTSTGDSPLYGKLDAIGYGFFIPIFFITVGVGFDLPALVHSIAAALLVPMLFIAAYLIKVGPALVYRFLFPWRETFAAGVLLSSRLSLIVAASAIALDRDLITTATNSALILMAVVTCTFSPVVFSRILPPAPVEHREGVVILGTDQLAVLLGQWLSRSGEQVTFVGRDEPQLNHMEGKVQRIVAGNPEDTRVLSAAGLGSARALIVASHSPTTVLSVCRVARERFGVPVLIARADDQQLVRELQALNVRVVQPATAVALALAGALRFPTAFAMLMDTADGVDVLDVPLNNRSLAGRPLHRIRLPGDALVLGIQRQGEVIVPHGDTVVNQGDVLALAGSPKSLQEARVWIAGEADSNVAQHESEGF